MGKRVNEVVNKISGDLRVTLDEFLHVEEYQEQFAEMAKAVGYTGDDPDMIRLALFTVKEGEIGFVIGELNEKFFNYQIEKSLKNDPGYSDFIKEFPEALPDLVKMSAGFLRKGEADEAELEKVLMKYLKPKEAKNEG